MFTHNLRLWIESLKEGEIFFAKTAYDEYFEDAEEATFYQLIARLYKEGYLGKIAKGLYFRPYKDDKTKMPPIENIINFFTNKGKKGTLIGAYKFKELGLIDNPTGDYEIYTDCHDIKTVRKLNGFNVKQVKLDYRNDVVVTTLLMLEINENIDNYEDVNIEALKAFIEKFVSIYKEDVLYKVLQAKSYKKRNLYLLSVILDKYGVENHISRYLNKASKYQTSRYILEAIGE